MGSSSELCAAKMHLSGIHLQFDVKVLYFLPARKKAQNGAVDWFVDVNVLDKLDYQLLINDWFLTLLAGFNFIRNAQNIVDILQEVLLNGKCPTIHMD